MIEAQGTHSNFCRSRSNDDSRVLSLFRMTDVSEVHWKALERIQVGRIPSKVNIQRLLEIRCIAITAHGELRITGLGRDALNRYHHRLQSAIETDSKAVLVEDQTFGEETTSLEPVSTRHQ